MLIADMKLLDPNEGQFITAVAVARVLLWFVPLPVYTGDSRMLPITPRVALLEEKSDLRELQPHNR